MIRAAAPLALLVLSGCHALLVLAPAAFSIGSQAVGLTAGVEQLVQQNGLRVGPPPVSACPIVPAVMPKASAMNGEKE